MAWTRFQIGADIHGDKQDKAANEAFFKFADLWKPTLRICLGDVWNFAAIRRGVDANEKRDSMQRDRAEGAEWLKRFRPNFLTRGNHDERAFDLAREGAGIEKDWATGAIEEIEKLTKKLGCRMLPYDKRAGILKLGHLKAGHGFKCGVNAAREQARTYGNIAVGHGHGIQMQSIEGLDSRCGWMIGCLCQLDQNYNRAHTGALVHEHGWAYGVLNDRSGDFLLWQARRAGKHWMLPTGIQEL